MFKCMDSKICNEIIKFYAISKFDHKESSSILPINLHKLLLKKNTTTFKKRCRRPPTATFKKRCRRDPTLRQHLDLQPVFVVVYVEEKDKSV